jgi:hypothetical protein
LNDKSGNVIVQDTNKNHVETWKMLEVGNWKRDQGGIFSEILSSQYRKITKPCRGG